MKVDKRDPKHWIYLMLSGIWVVFAIGLRPFVRRRNPHRVLLYGHKLSGNLLALYKYMRRHTDEFDVVFLTMDPDYKKVLSGAGERALLCTSPRCIGWFASADALVSDHGLHALQPLLYLSTIKFFDVWHGIPFKGFDGADFEVQRRYDEAWVTSPLLKSIYVDRYQFPSERVRETGNPRTDLIVNHKGEQAAAKEAYGLPADRKVILFAPTWKQDSKDRSIFPFETTDIEFMSLLAGVARRHQAVVALRTHLNSRMALTGPLAGNVVHVPFAQFPDTERLLVATDLLVCDWSSIAFDYLVLERPAIFLDVKPPFRKGFSLDSSYRYGEVVSNTRELEVALDLFLGDATAFKRKYGAAVKEITERVYAGRNDGLATERCMTQLRSAMAKR